MHAVHTGYTHATLVPCLIKVMYGPYEQFTNFLQNRFTGPVQIERLLRRQVSNMEGYG